MNHNRSLDTSDIQGAKPRQYGRHIWGNNSYVETNEQNNPLIVAQANKSGLINNPQNYLGNNQKPVNYNYVPKPNFFNQPSDFELKLQKRRELTRNESPSKYLRQYQQDNSNLYQNKSTIGHYNNYDNQPSSMTQNAVNQLPKQSNQYQSEQLPYIENKSQIKTPQSYGNNSNNTNNNSNNNHLSATELQLLRLKEREQELLRQNQRELELIRQKQKEQEQKVKEQQMRYQQEKLQKSREQQLELQRLQEEKLDRELQYYKQKQQEQEQQKRQKQQQEQELQQYQLEKEQEQQKQRMYQLQQEQEEQEQEEEERRRKNQEQEQYEEELRQQAQREIEKSNTAEKLRELERKRQLILEKQQQLQLDNYSSNNTKNIPSNTESVQNSISQKAQGVYHNYFKSYNRNLLQQQQNNIFPQSQQQSQQQPSQNLSNFEPQFPNRKPNFVFERSKTPQISRGKKHFNPNNVQALNSKVEEHLSPIKNHRDAVDPELWQKKSYILDRQKRQSQQYNPKNYGNGINFTSTATQDFRRQKGQNSVDFSLMKQVVKLHKQETLKSDIFFNSSQKQQPQIQRNYNTNIQQQPKEQQHEQQQQKRPENLDIQPRHQTPIKKQEEEQPYQVSKPQKQQYQQQGKVRTQGGHYYQEQNPYKQQTSIRKTSGQGNLGQKDIDLAGRYNGYQDVNKQHNYEYAKNSDNANQKHKGVDLYGPKALKNLDNVKLY